MGHIIVIEGLDKSGKETQSKLLESWIHSVGYSAVRVEIPDYSTPIGEEIRGYLYNQRDYSPREFQMLMLMNRYEVQSVLLRMLEEYDFLILDRYHLSGLAYGAVDGLDEQLLKKLGSNLLQPNMGILLDLPAEESINRRREHLDNDKHESNKEFLERVRSQYLRLARSSEHNYHIFDALKSKEELHNNITKWVSITFRIGY